MFDHMHFSPTEYNELQTKERASNTLQYFVALCWSTSVRMQQARNCCHIAGALFKAGADRVSRGQRRSISGTPPLHPFLSQGR